MRSRLAVAFEMMRNVENIDARHHFTCCQSCGSAQLRALEDATNDTIGYCFYHAQDAEDIAECKVLYLSYGGFETPDVFWVEEDVADVVRKALEDCDLVVEWNGDSTTRIRVLLDDESIDFVQAVADGFANGERVAYDWKYFDFEAEWDRFAEHWYSDEVQTVLKRSIDQLGLDDNRMVRYPDSTPIRRDAWEKGDPLWHLSRTNYSYSRFRDRNTSELNGAFISYNRTMAQFNHRLCKTKYQFVESELWAHALYSIAKQERSIHGLIYTDSEYLDEHDEDRIPDVVAADEHIAINSPGRIVLNDALKKVAEVMFTDVSIANSQFTDDAPLLIVVKDNLVFDLIGYYFSKYQEWSGSAVEEVADLFRLNQLKSMLNV